jgi:hypothetical protein
MATNSKIYIQIFGRASFRILQYLMVMCICDRQDVLSFNIDMFILQRVNQWSYRFDKILISRYVCSHRYIQREYKRGQSTYVSLAGAFL